MLKARECARTISGARSHNDKVHVFLLETVALMCARFNDVSEGEGCSQYQCVILRYWNNDTRHGGITKGEKRSSCAVTRPKNLTSEAAAALPAVPSPFSYKISRC